MDRYYSRIGLLSEDFSNPYLLISEHDPNYIQLTPEVVLPTRPFPGTVGVAPSHQESLPLIPPHAPIGGNIDCKNLTRGSSLFLPVQVPGALLSIGDTHAAQGDGEVCGTAVETPIQLSCRVDLIKEPPTLSCPRILSPELADTSLESNTSMITTAIEDNLMTASQNAVRRMIEWTTSEYHISEELAYCICSIAGDLQIKEIVNDPHIVVGCRLPTSIFV